MLLLVASSVPLVAALYQRTKLFAPGVALKLTVPSPQVAPLTTVGVAGTGLMVAVICARLLSQLVDVLKLLTQYDVVV